MSNLNHMVHFCKCYIDEKKAGLPAGQPELAAAFMQELVKLCLEGPYAQKLSPAATMMAVAATQCALAKVFVLANKEQTKP